MSEDILAQIFRELEGKKIRESKDSYCEKLVSAYHQESKENAEDLSEEESTDENEDVEDETFDSVSEYPVFDQLPPSTHTMIAVSNFKIDLSVLFKYIPTVKFTLPFTKRGRKPAMEPKIEYNKGILPGSIISANSGGVIKGIKMKKDKKKKKATSKTHFLNSMSVVIILDNQKQVNCKVSRHGKFQLTGCKKKEYGIEAVILIMKYINRIEKETGEVILSMKNVIDAGEVELILEEPEIIFIVVMRNIDFKLGYKIQRDLLNYYINSECSPYYSLYEPEMNPGVSIKKLIISPFDEKLECLNFVWFNNCKRDLTCTMDHVPFKRYYDLLSEKDKKIHDASKNDKYLTFMTFHSGAVVFSGRGPTMEYIYNDFLKKIRRGRHIFEEKLDL